MNQRVLPKHISKVTKPIASRRGTFDVSFFRQGRRTKLGRQFVSYPFHLTRPFSLDDEVPELSTVYQQSSSGGLYRADELVSKYQIGQNAAVHVTTQSATIVHDCQGQAVHQYVDVRVQEGAFFAYLPDPLVLFPGAALDAKLRICVEPGAVVVVGETIAYHDPKDENRPFDLLTLDTEALNGTGRLLCRDRIQITGLQYGGTNSPVGKWRVMGNYLFIGAFERLPSRQTIEKGHLDDVILGVTSLPNQIGWGLRCMAKTAIAARGVVDNLFEVAVLAALGSRPAKRRK